MNEQITPEDYEIYLAVQHFNDNMEQIEKNQKRQRWLGIACIAMGAVLLGDLLIEDPAGNWWMAPVTVVVLAATIGISRFIRPRIMKRIFGFTKQEVHDLVEKLQRLSPESCETTDSAERD